MALRGLRGPTSLVVFLLASMTAVGCGGASDTDFTSDDGSAGDSAGEGANGGSSQGGSSQGGSSRGGTGGSSSGGSSQGGSEPTGGSSTGGTPSGGASGTDAGGATTGGTGAGGGIGGSVGGSAGTGSGGIASGGTGGLADCARIISDAEAALVSAQVCDPNAAAKCTGKVEDLCGCVVPVNDAASAQTQTYLERREAALKCGVPCLAIVCPEPTAVMCGFGGATARIVARAQCVYSPR